MAATKQKLSRLGVSKDGRYLVKEDGTLFFWQGDTAWELFHKLNREDADHYLQNRAELKFNVIQAVALAEDHGITTGNAYGRLPLLQNDAGEYDPTCPDLRGPDEHYWDHVDYIIEKAASLGIYIALLPTWGDKIFRKWGAGPEIFTVENARTYGQFLGERYRGQDNIIWVLGGDRRYETYRHYQIIHAMAEGIQEGDQGNHLITFHPQGSGNSADYVHDEPWLDFNMIQSGHIPGRKIYNMIDAAYQKQPTKPVLDGEPNYEDIPVGFKLENGFVDAVDVRRAAYWTVFSGACGHTYGHHSVWYMTTEPSEQSWINHFMHWKEGILRPGAAQMQHLRALVESSPWLSHFPDQSLIVENFPGVCHMVANRSEQHALIYSPCGLPFRVKMGILQGEQVKACWFNPRQGDQIEAGTYTNIGETRFTPPSLGRGEDWVLILTVE